jgi:acetone carboxylase beta subunit
MQLKRDVLALAIDAGGTMTDTFVVDSDGNFVIGKASTTPWDESVGFMESAQDALGAWDMEDRDAFSQFEVCTYSGTTMLNTLLQRKGRKAGLIVTKGMEDILLMEQGRQVWSGYSYSDRLHAVTHVHNEPLIPKRRIRGVSERIDLFGNVVIPLYEVDARKCVEELLDEGVDSIVICFIYSYANASHELLMEKICKEVMAERNVSVPVFPSSRVRPVIRENQRVNATVIEAYAADPVRKQLHNVENSAREKGFSHQLTTMLSYGGLANIRHPRLHETLVSGPIGGMLGAKYVASILGLNNVLATDMGGTSYDFGMISRGQLTLNNEPELARFRMNLPSIALDSTTGGAGSYLSVDPITKRINMGPESAGGDPGPVCYDKGNLTPTVTDCLAVNGYVNPDYFLGGKVVLNVEKAYTQLKEKIADPLGLDVHQAADGVVKIWLQNAREATRRAIQSV